MKPKRFIQNPLADPHGFCQPGDQVLSVARLGLVGKQMRLKQIPNLPVSPSLFPLHCLTGPLLPRSQNLCDFIA